MASNRHYHAPQTTSWQGRSDLPPQSSFFQIITLLDLTKPLKKAEKPAFALLGFCSDEGVGRNKGRLGAEAGPRAIREVLAKMPIHQHDILCYDAGDISCLDSDLETAQQTLAEMVAILLSHTITPIILGGGHEVAYGHYLGLAKHLSTETLGIVNFDAHFDMRPLLPENKGSSGTPFLQIAKVHEEKNQRFDYNCIGIQPAGNMDLLFKTAAHYQTHVLTAEEMQAPLNDKAIPFLQRILIQNDRVYLSLCLDVFAAPFAPGVSAPQPFGLLPWQVLPLVRFLAQSGKVLSYDIAELAPKYDIDQRTAKLAAQFVHEIIHHHKK